MPKALARIVFSMTLIFGSAEALAENACADVFLSPTYFQQVVSSKGTRLFFKESRPETQEKKWLGLVRRTPKGALDRSWKVSNYLRFIIKSLPLKIFGVTNYKDYEITPFQAVYENTIVRPSHWLSQKLVNKKMEPTLFIRVPIAITLSLLSWSQIDGYYAEKLSNRIDQNVATYSETYKELINNDFRYRQIKSDFDKKKISEKEALTRAYWENMAYEEYFNYVDSNKDAAMTLKSEAKLLKHFVFAHLQSVFENGVSQKEGFFIPQEKLGPISDSQKLELFKINHVLSLRYQLIVEAVKNTELYKESHNDPEIQSLIELSFSSSFGRQLVEFHEQGKINDNELIKFLQEEAYWQARIAEWATVGVVKLKKKDGVYQNTPLKIEDIQREIVQEIQNGKF